jgi:hypothetical protein
MPFKFKIQNGSSENVFFFFLHASNYLFGLFMCFGIFTMLLHHPPQSQRCHRAPLLSIFFSKFRASGVRASTHLELTFAEILKLRSINLLDPTVLIPHDLTTHISSSFRVLGFCVSRGRNIFHLHPPYSRNVDFFLDN